MEEQATPTGGVPAQFPSADPQDLAHVTAADVKTKIVFVEDTLTRLRAKYANAVTETSVEFQAIKVLEQVLPMLQALLALAK